MQEHENIIPGEGSQESEPSIHKIERTRQLIIEKDLRDMRSELEKIFQYERDLIVQNITEKEIRFEKALAETKDQVADLQKQVQLLQKEVERMKREKIDSRKLAIVLSDLSLQLMRSSEKHEE